MQKLLMKIMLNKYDDLKSWRQDSKRIVVLSMGGSCAICRI